MLTSQVVAINKHAFDLCVLLCLCGLYISQIVLLLKVPVVMYAATHKHFLNHLCDNNNSLYIVLHLYPCNPWCTDLFFSCCTRPTCFQELISLLLLLVSSYMHAFLLTLVSCIDFIIALKRVYIPKLKQWENVMTKEINYII